MDTHILVNTIHILSATFLFGTGIGIATFFFFSNLADNPPARRFSALAPSGGSNF